MIDYTNSAAISDLAPSVVPATRSARAVGEVRALFHGHLIASSQDVFVVRREDEPAQYYFPADAIEKGVLQPNKRRLSSALGEAQCLTLYRDGEIIEDAAWTYPVASATVGEIADMIAFNPDHVDIEISVQPAAESPGIDDYIRHTDSGAGRSQEEAWDPTVGRPGEGV